jgi:hypothetical protein
MTRISDLLGRQPCLRILLLGALSVAVLGALDYVTGYEISFSIFYLLPVSMIAWFVGRRAGILISVGAAASWLLAELLAGSSTTCALRCPWFSRGFERSKRWAPN